MNTISILEMENIQAGGSTAGNVINGACAAIALGGLLGWVALANPYDKNIRVVCLGNTIGQGMGWW